MSFLLRSRPLHGGLRAFMWIRRDNLSLEMSDCVLRVWSELLYSGGWFVVTTSMVFMSHRPPTRAERAGDRKKGWTRIMRGGGGTWWMAGCWRGGSFFARFAFKKKKLACEEIGKTGGCMVRVGAAGGERGGGRCSLAAGSLLRGRYGRMLHCSHVANSVAEENYGSRRPPRTP